MTSSQYPESAMNSLYNQNIPNIAESTNHSYADAVRNGPLPVLETQYSGRMQPATLARNSRAPGLFYNTFQVPAQSTSPAACTPPAQVKPTFAQVVARNGYENSPHHSTHPILNQSGAYDVNVGLHGMSALQRQSPNPTHNTPTSLTSNASNINPYYFTDPPYDLNFNPQNNKPNWNGWINEHKVVGDRGRPDVDLVSPLMAGQETDKSLRSLTITSSRKSGRRRNKRELQSGNHEYRCLKCNAGFDSSGELKNHAETHKLKEERKHGCSARSCGKRFRYHKDLTRHEKTHEDIRTEYPCCLCQTTCNRVDNLNRHMRKKHAENLSESGS
jgi:hypothetical protein